MEEDPNEKKKETDWSILYDEQMHLIEQDEQKSDSQSSNITLPTSQKLPKQNEQKPSSNKYLYLIEILLFFVAFILFTQLRNPGVFVLYLIIAICIWKIGKASKTKPYEYLYQKTNRDSGENYLPNSKFDQTYISHQEETLEEKIRSKIVKQESPHSTIIYRNFQKAAEYNTNWLNLTTQTLNIAADDDIILSHWTPLKIKMKISFNDSIKNFIMLCVYFGLYALITYFVLDRGEGNLDNTVQALFFPIFPYILICYRGFDKYLKALVSTFILMSIVFIPLFNNRIITEDGIPFLRYFSFIDDYFPTLMNSIVNISGTNTAISFTNQVLVIIFIFEFILLILYSLVKTLPYIDIVISRKALFIRAKTKKSIFDTLKIILWIILNPFNIKQYRDIQKRIKYNQMTSKEGHLHDFSRIPPDVVHSIKKKKYSIGFRIVISILFFIIGYITVFMMGNPLGIPIFGMGLIYLIRTLKRRGKYHVRIHVDRSKVEGSWILSHSSNIFKLIQVPESIAQYFKPL
jgi:hypothetical protein